MKNKLIILTALFFMFAKGSFAQNTLTCDSLFSTNTIVKVLPKQDTVYFSYSYSGPHAGVEGGIYVNQYVKIPDGTAIVSIDVLHDAVPFLTTYIYKEQKIPLLINYGVEQLPDNFKLECEYNVLVGTSGEICSIPFTIEFDINSDIASTKPYGSIIVSPNPLRDHTIIKVNEMQLGSQYRIFDVSGVEMLSGTLLTQTTKVDMSILPNGLYYIYIEIDSNFGKAIKIIKE